MAECQVCKVWYNVRYIDKLKFSHCRVLQNTITVFYLLACKKLEINYFHTHQQDYIFKLLTSYVFSNINI